MLEANLAATAFAISCLTLGWWSLEAEYPSRSRFLHALAALCLPAATVGWIFIRTYPLTWPLGAGVAGIIYLLLFGKRIDRLVPATRRIFRAVALGGLVAGLAVTATPSVLHLSKKVASPSAVILAQRQDVAELTAAATALPNSMPGLGMALQQLQANKHFDQLIYLDAADAVAYSTDPSLIPGRSLLGNWPWYHLKNSGFARLPSGQLAEIISTPSLDGQLVTVRYLNPGYLAKIGNSENLATSTSAGITAASSSGVPVAIWQSTEMDAYARALHGPASEPIRVTYAGQGYLLRSESLPTLDGTQAYLLSLVHA